MRSEQEENKSNTGKNVLEEKPHLNYTFRSSFVHRHEKVKQVS